MGGVVPVSIILIDIQALTKAVYTLPYSHIVQLIALNGLEFFQLPCCHRWICQFNLSFNEVVAILWFFVFSPQYSLESTSLLPLAGLVVFSMINTSFSVSLNSSAKSSLVRHFCHTTYSIHWCLKSSKSFQLLPCLCISLISFLSIITFNKYGN